MIFLGIDENFLGQKEPRQAVYQKFMKIMMSRPRHSDQSRMWFLIRGGYDQLSQAVYEYQLYKVTIIEAELGYKTDNTCAPNITDYYNIC